MYSLPIIVNVKVRYESSLSDGAPKREPVPPLQTPLNGRSGHFHENYPLQRVPFCFHSR